MFMLLVVCFFFFFPFGQLKKNTQNLKASVQNTTRNFHDSYKESKRQQKHSALLDITVIRDKAVLRKLFLIRD